MEPVGLSEAEVIRTLAGLRALGEIMNVTTPRLDGILDRARAELELRPSVPPGGPPGPPGPPTPPPVP